MKLKLSCAALLCCLFASTSQLASQAAPHPGILAPAELGSIFPPSVFFSGQTAPVQLRNSFGVRSEAGKLTLFALVDNSGYASSLQQRYQFYLLTEVPVEVEGHRIAPGAYGGGFLSGQGLVLMDLGANELFHAATAADAAMARPRPLQVLSGAAGSEYRLCLGRTCVPFHQVPRGKACTQKL